MQRRNSSPRVAATLPSTSTPLGVLGIGRTLAVLPFTRSGYIFWLTGHLTMPTLAAVAPTIGETHKNGGPKRSMQHPARRENVKRKPQIYDRARPKVLTIVDTSAQKGVL